MMSESHEHDWTADPDDTGGYVTIDIDPPLVCYWCRVCGVVTHDPETGEICTIGHYRLAAGVMVQPK